MISHSLLMKNGMPGWVAAQFQFISARIKQARFHGLIGHGSAPVCNGQPYSAFTAMTSTSASTPLGSAFTATQERAGLPVKYFA